MTFDAGTWWLAIAVLGVFTSGFTYMFKISIFGRVDAIDKKLSELTRNYTTKSDHEKDVSELKLDIKKIKENYTPLKKHEKDFDECRNDIKTIKDVYLSKDDFYRENAKVERKIDQNNHKLDRIIDMIIKNHCYTEGA